MGKLILKPEILEALKNDSVAIGYVAEILEVNFTTMPKWLQRNDPRLTQAGVLKYLRNRFNVSKDSDLLCEMQPA